MQLPLMRFRIEDNGMEPEFKEGDYVVVNKWAYALGNPGKGDVVVVKHPREERMLIKRVACVKGEEVFVIGDNFACSEDSVNFGAVKRSGIIGKAIIHAQRRGKR